MVAEIDLTTLDERDDFVLHFGGRPNEVDAFTFSNSLLAFSEAMREINSQINPLFALTISIEGTGPGSFRAQIKTKLKSITALFSLKADARSLVIGVLGNAVYGVLSPANPPHNVITLDAEKVVVQTGQDTIIMKRTVWDATQALPHPEAVQKHIAQGYSAMSEDASVTGFGTTFLILILWGSCPVKSLSCTRAFMNMELAHQRAFTMNIMQN